MTQYTDQVEYHKRKMAVEKWAKQCQYILGEKGYVETAFNSGLITREYRDGTFEVVEESKDMATLLLEAPSNI
tara:strand:+ start:2235 stop:2453 length:219 start_codon:yes stop_codon:yes gene_type:complete